MFGGDIFTDQAIRQANAAARQHAENAEIYLKRAIVNMNGNACNLGIRFALANQLEKCDPDNPLLKDQKLVQQVMDAALAEFKRRGDHYDGAREAGRNFPVPPSPTKRMQPPVLLGNTQAEHFKEGYAGVIALRNAFSEQLRKLDPENPLLTDTALVERIRKNGVSAFRLGGDSFDAARDVGTSFSIPGR